MPIVQRVMRTGAQVAGAVRDVGRLTEIVQVLGKNGFGFVLDRLHLPGIDRIRGIDPSREHLPLPERARLAMEELGPTFVKLGQVLSTRDDIIPVTWCEAFESLQDNVKPVEFEAIRAQLLASLGEDHEEAFEHFDVEPLAAASMAQVHRAVLKGGEEVVLKVQRPGLKRIIDTDLDILRFLARRLEKQVPELMVMDLQGMLADFERSIKEEMDFRREADYTDRFKRNLSVIPGVYVPMVYREHSSREVLCLEFLAGIKMREARSAGFDMAWLGRVYFQAAAQMLFVDGFFHGDLHPGNVIVMEGPRLGLIDFGMAGFLSEEMKDNVCAILYGVAQKDFRTVARVMFQVGIPKGPVHYTMFESEVMELMQRRLVGRAMGDIQVGPFLTELLQGAIRHGLKVPNGYTMLFKAIMTTEGLAKDLLPEMDPVEEFRPVLEKAVRARFSRERLTRDLTVHLLSSEQLLRRLPIVGEQIIAEYEAGRFRVPVTIQTNPTVERLADRRLSMLGAAIVEAALLLGAVMSMDKPQWTPLGIPVITTLLFLAAMASAVVMLVLVFWRARGRIEE